MNRFRAVLRLWLAGAALAAIRLVATGAVLELRPAAKNWGLVLHSSTVVQSLTDVAQGERSLATTYYQAEGWWQPSGWFGIQTELEGGQVIGRDQAENLGINLGSQWKLNEMQEDPDLYVPIFFLMGRTPDGALAWRLGKISPENSFDDNRGAHAKRTKFLSQPLYKDTAIAAPNKGLGGYLRWTASPRAELAFCVSDANARNTLSSLTTLRGEWFRSAELTFRPLTKTEDATVRVLAWATERGGGRDDGWSVSADWEIAPTWVIFTRAGDGSERFARSRQFISSGVAWEAPFGRTQDFFGLGLARAKAVLGNTRTETLVEAIYRWQINRNFALSPDLQYIRQPARSTVGSAWLFGLRWSMSYVR